MTAPSLILTLACPDRRGIVAAVSTFLAGRDCNILDAQQYDDAETGRFFMRVVFDPNGSSAEDLRAAFTATGAEFSMTWTLRDPSQRYRVMILASRTDHCLADLLYRWRIEELPMDISAVVSNHGAQTFQHVDLKGLPFHHLPVAKDTKLEQESQLWSLIRETQTDIVVLARYTQILSDGLAAKLEGRCINIHHSFLPGFKGAKPYHQAHERGVKMIGATAHFVSEVLDDGPIIAQATVPVDHSRGPAEMAMAGRDVEKIVLAKALKLVLEDRVFLNGRRTLVFE
jgi:formyltetrahydrofolate deformylase